MQKPHAHEELLGGIKYFHGTGNMSHDFGDNKYEDIIDGTRNTLDEILKKGLEPFPDPLNPNYSATISVTDDPMYAVLYSLLYSEKGTSKKFGVQRGKEWSKVLWKIFTQANAFSLKKYKVQGKRIVGLKEFRKWGNSFNNTDYKNKIFGSLRSMVWGESNIKGNFPVVLGIKEIGEIKPMPGWNEIRTSDTIPPEQIGAIFIPRDNIGELEGYTHIPIYPIEDLITSLYGKLGKY